MKKISIAAGVFLFCFLLGIFLFLILSFSSSRPKEKGDISFSALTTNVKVIWDKWGVPHIFADNDRDLFFAVGYIHAQERMWQMDLLRRVGFGRLSEVFGSQTLNSDRFLRNYGFREAVLKDYANLSEELKDFLSSYCCGVNAWLNSRRHNWPPEFMLLRFRPEAWGILDSLIIKEILALSLCPDFPSELVRARLVRKLGLEKASEVLEQGAGVSSLEEIPLLEVNQNFFDFVLAGSNNWVLAGGRTTSGKPLLANDPHLQFSLPPIWFEMDLHSPGFRVAGVTFPGVPLIVIGHNASIAWGLTNSAADVQDLYIERLSDSGDSYLDKDGWKPLLKKEEVIRVRGRDEPEKLDILWTERGPILSRFIIENNIPVSLSWTIQEGGRIFESLFLINKARNWDEFCRAAALWDAPSMNIVYADVQGNIGYYLTGLIPLRKKSAALFPAQGWVPENRWEGFLEEAQKPVILNPKEGYIITANNKIVPEDYPYYVSSDFDVPFRYNRIKELLLQKEKHAVDSLKRIQNDVHSKRAELFLPLIKGVNPADAGAKKAQEILQGWNGEMGATREAALFAVFMKTLEQELLAGDLGPEYKNYSIIFYRKQAGLLRVLSHPVLPRSGQDLADSAGAQEEVLASSLAKAYSWLEEKYGQPDNWDWTKMHSLTFPHALGRVPLLGFFNRGPYPTIGDSFSIRASFSQDTIGNYRTTWGVSYRQIIDLADLKNSVCILNSGQSGHPFSKHYDDQIPLWLNGDYRPMLFYPEDIEANVAAVFLFKAPSKKK